MSNPMSNLLCRGPHLAASLLVLIGTFFAVSAEVIAAEPGNSALPDSTTARLEAVALYQAGDSQIDFVGADPASSNGVIVATVLDYSTNSDGTATAQIKVRNTTSLWYKLYVEAIGDVDFNFDPRTLEDEEGKFLYLPPEGATDFAYPTLKKTVTFNDPSAGLTFMVDRSIESGIGALFLQQLEILSRAGTGIPALPHDRAGAMVEAVKATTQGLDPFIDAANAIRDGDVDGTIAAVSELGRTPEAIDALQVAFAKIGTSITEDQIKSATTLLSIFSLSWYIAEFIGESLGSAGGDSSTVKAFDFDGSSPTLNARMTTTGGGQSAPAEVSFDAGASQSSEAIASYTWKFDDGSSSASGESISHVFSQPGTYEVRLTVTDTEGNTDQTTQTVRVFAPSLTIDRQALYEFEFEAAQNGEVTGYSWDFGDGTTGSGRTPVHTYGSRGEYELTLTLSTTSGSTTQVTRTIFAGPRPVRVSGTVDGNHIWPASHGPFIVEKKLSVVEGVTLTIDPGVVVKVEPREGQIQPGLRVQGALEAVGTEENPIIFTSIKDDEYGGDTNGDGNESTPSSGDWRRLYVGNTGRATIRHAVIRYGGDVPYDNEMVETAGGDLTLTDSRIGHSSGIGLLLFGSGHLVEKNTFVSNETGARVSSGTTVIENNIFEHGTHGAEVFGADATVRNNTFKNHTDYPIEVRERQGAGSPEITDNSGSNNEANGISYLGTITSSAHWKTNGLSHVLSKKLNVNKDGKLKIDPGVVVKVEPREGQIQPGLRVQGALEAVGTEENPIIFTSIKDDEYGGDTNGDGNESTPSSGDWRRLYVGNTGRATIRHAVIRYGGDVPYDNEMVETAGGDLTLTDSRIAHSSGIGVAIQTGTPVTIGNDTFLHNKIGLRVSQNSTANLGTGSDYGWNVFKNNADHAIENHSSGTVQAIGNYWNATSASAIDDKIYDDEEDSGSGPVLFKPFLDAAPAEGTPFASPDDSSTSAGSVLTVAAPGVLENDTDPDGDDLEISLVNGGSKGNVGSEVTLGSGALLTLEADGSFIYDPNRAFEDLGSGETGTDSFTYTAADGTGKTDQATVEITIEGVLTRALSVAPGWNMVSMPLKAGGASSKTLGAALPGGCGTRWRWAGGSYQQFGSEEALPAGGGAWTFCESGGTATVEGTPVSEKTVQVESGWNQVGPFETAIAPGEVGQDPSGILEAGTWYRWDPAQGQYTKPTELKTGVGYWVFATGSGTLDFSGGGSKAATASAGAQPKKEASAPEKPEGALTLKVTDEAGRSREVYLAGELTKEERRRWRLPPVGPGGTFAVRFEGGFQAAGAGGSKEEDEPPSEGAVLKVQGAEGAVTLRRQVPDQNRGDRLVQVRDAVTGGDRVDVRLRKKSPSVQVPADAEKLRLQVEQVPREAALQKPYPNPARGQVTLEYALPERRAVTIAVYDVLGRKVATLVEGQKEAGTYEARLEPRQSASGTYFVRMRAEGFQKTRRVAILR